LALVFLWIYPGAYQLLFILAVIPGLLAVVSTLLLKEQAAAPTARKERPGFFAFIQNIPDSSLAYRRLLYGLLAFAVLNSSDLFLLLVLKEKGMSDTVLIGFYIFYNLVYALTAYPVGIFADRRGKKLAFLIGIVFFVLVYGGLALGSNWWWLGLLFFGYGLYAAFTEGVAKAWISNLCRPEDTATAVGTYDGLSSIASLVSSSLAGVVWYIFGPAILFGGTAVLVGLVGVYFWGLEED
jgi:MFS family permease